MLRLAVPGREFYPQREPFENPLIVLSCRWQPPRRKQNVQSLVPIGVFTDLHGHDRQSAIWLDALCEPDTGCAHVAAFGNSGRIRVLYPSANVGTAARWLVYRSTRPETLHHGRGNSLRYRLERNGVRHNPSTALFLLWIGGNWRCVCLQRLYRFSPEVVSESSRICSRPDRRRLWQRHVAFRAGYLVFD